MRKKAIGQRGVGRWAGGAGKESAFMLSVSSLALALPAAQSRRPQFVGFYFERLERWALWSSGALCLLFPFLVCAAAVVAVAAAAFLCFSLLMVCARSCVAWRWRRARSLNVRSPAAPVRFHGSPPKTENQKPKPKQNKFNHPAPPLTRSPAHSLTHEHKYSPKSHKKNTYTTRVFVFSTALSNSCELVNFRFLYSPLFSDQRSRPTHLAATPPPRPPIYPFARRSPLGLKSIVKCLTKKWSQNFKKV